MKVRPLHDRVLIKRIEEQNAAAAGVRDSGPVATEDDNAFRVDHSGPISKVLSDRWLPRIIGDESHDPSGRHFIKERRCKYQHSAERLYSGLGSWVVIPDKQPAGRIERNAGRPRESLPNKQIRIRGWV